MEQKLFKCILTLMREYNRTADDRIYDAILSVIKCLPSTCSLDYSFIPLCVKGKTILGY